jgi:hypothetical protein
MAIDNSTGRDKARKLIAAVTLAWAMAGAGIVTAVLAAPASAKPATPSVSCAASALAGRGGC